MTDPNAEEQVKPRTWRSISIPVLSIGIMAVLCAIALKTLLWFADPPSPPNHREEPLVSEAIAKDVPPYTFPPGVAEDLRNARSLEVYLVGIRPDYSDKGESFHNWPVFGSTRVTSSKAVESIVESLIRGVAYKEDEPFGCFFPRHGISASLKDGRRIDLVICYHCRNMEVYTSEEPVEVYTLSDSRPLLNKTLQNAGVDLKQPVVSYMFEP
ncbi:MAG TPA: hypothetical protein VF789_29775 [Thermoanaerobaculia bacterium]